MINFVTRLLEFIQEEFEYFHYKLHTYYKCKNKKSINIEMNQ